MKPIKDVTLLELFHLIVLVNTLAVVSIGIYGLGESIGYGWSIAVILGALYFLRYVALVPALVGTYMASVHQWGWHEAFGALLIMPGILITLFQVAWGYHIKRQMAK